MDIAVRYQRRPDAKLGKTQRVHGTLSRHFDAGNKIFMFEERVDETSETAALVLKHKGNAA
ncbi:hypothetical protein SDC9_147051 [bioreactor metagenome]|uniref:Uncharacterized protein n=1 Tax=bioreactor metagenome TaxID=1076179 RepID=A0A645EDP4_9ZZZZ